MFFAIGTVLLTVALVTLLGTFAMIIRLCLKNSNVTEKSG